MLKDCLLRFRSALARPARHGLCLTAGAAILGWTGNWHWLPELFSHFFIQYALLLLILTPFLFWDRAGHWRWAALVVCALLGYLMLSFWLPADDAPQTQAPTTRLRILQFNAARNTEPLTHWLMQHRQEVDVVLVQETGPDFAAAMAALEEEFPYRLAQLESAFGIALLSRYPLHEARTLKLVDADFPALEAYIIAPSGPLHFVGIHPPPPLSEELARWRNRYMKKLLPLLENTQPVLVLGDFNSTVWSPRLREFMDKTHLRDAQRGFGPLASWPAATARYGGILGIPIDLMLVSDTLRVEERHAMPPLGSDHLPILTHIAY
jgi:endonuclease/exonuclease/phosphatase (EEP) superfamily protein YafD